MRVIPGESRSLDYSSCVYSSIRPFFIVNFEGEYGPTKGYTGSDGFRVGTWTLNPKPNSSLYTLYTPLEGTKHRVLGPSGFCLGSTLHLILFNVLPTAWIS